MLTADAIRQHFPSPRSVPLDEDVDCSESYCVGGAVCISVGRPERFPSPSYLSDALLTLNPTLTPAQAFQLSVAIIRANDREDFSHAWALVDEALSEGSAL